MEIVKQDCYTIVIELLEETLFRAYSIMDKLGFPQSAGVKNYLDTRVSNAISHFEGINVYRENLTSINDLATV